MKKLIFWGAAALLAAVSCNKELENTTPVLPEGDRVSFVATVDGAETKTVMGDIDVKGEKAVALWDGIEAIRVLDGTVSKVFQSEEVEKAETATFSELDVEEILEGDDYFAVYPEGPCGSVTWIGDIAEPAKKFWLVGDQTPVVNSYDPSAHIAVAYTEAGKNDLYFKNVVSLISFTIGSDNVSEVRFSGNNEEILSGNFDVTYNLSAQNEAELLTISATGNDYYTMDYASVKAGDGKTLSKGKRYYVAVLPNDFTNGITVETIVNGVTSKKKTKSFNLNRNTILSLGLVEWSAPEWGIRGSMNNWGTTPDIAMTLDGDWYVAENVELKATDEFKFYYDDGSQDGAWRGVLNDTPAEVGETALDGDSNISVELPGIYTVSLSKDTEAMKLEKTADLELDVIDPATAGVDKVRVGLTGSKATWNWGDPSSEKGSLATFASKEVTNAEDFSGNYTFTMTGVEFEKSEEFKIRVDIDGVQGWYGVGTTVSGIAYKGGDNFVVSAAGTYDVAISFKYDGEKQSVSNISAEFTKTSVDPEPEPEPTTKKLYLVPGEWNQAGATFDVWHWADGKDGAWETMTVTSDSKVFECSIPVESNNAIFIRRDPAKPSKTWDNEGWNRTGNEEIGTNNCFTITGWNGGNGNNNYSKGTWSIR